MPAQEIYLIRHATAEATSASRNDRDRNLTSAGIDEALCCARCLQALGIVVDSIRTSPIARARQTAEIIAHHYDLPVIVDERVGPGFDVAVMQNFAAARGVRALAFVSHEPDIDWIVWSTTGIKQQTQTASVTRLEPAGSRWKRAFYLAPPAQAAVLAHGDPWSALTGSGEPLDG
ncbi:MAG: hypothetical protein RLZZ297_179 [Chloroflexota bacterium]|jgi:phosphohistidine phosphatase SixA